MDKQNVDNEILFSLRKEILAQATAWMKLEGTELREGSSVKDKFCMIPLP